MHACTAGLLLKEYKAKFEGSPVTATYSYMRQVLVSSLPQNPLVTHETDWERLRDPHFLNRTLRYAPRPPPLCCVLGPLAACGAAL